MKIRFRVRSFTTATLCVLLSAVSGCGLADREKRPAAMMSFDLFLNDQLGAIGYAQEKLRNDCLAKAGFPQARDLIRPRGRIPFPTLRIDAKMFGFVSAEDARTHGLGRDSPSEPGHLLGSDASFNVNLDKCEKQAWSVLGHDAQAVVQDYYALGNDLLGYRDEINRELPADLPSKFLDCMQTAGYPVKDRAQYLKAPEPKLWGVPLGKMEGDPDTNESPSPDDAVGGPGGPPPVATGVRISPPIPSRKYLPTAQESELAVSMYRCQQQVGVVGQSLEVAARVQRRLVEKNETRFTELNPKIETIAKRAAALVGDQ